MSVSSKGWHSRGYLPHFDSHEIVQFVTYRLSDSLPLEARERIRLSDRPESLRDELLDRSWGACWLRRPKIAEIVEQSFFAFDGERYRLHAWTIMPNHVHVLFGVLDGATLSDIVASWKKFTARQANRQLGRSGPFWLADYWGPLYTQRRAFRCRGELYRQQPREGRSRKTPAEWAWGSARFKG